MIYQIVSTNGISNQHSEVSVLRLTPEQAHILNKYSIELAFLGGPQAAAVKQKAQMYADELLQKLDESQLEILSTYAENKMTLLIVDEMVSISDDDLSTELPSLEELTQDHRCLALASRNQIILNLAGNRAFAYDLDYNEMVRLVGNFRGGGIHKIKNEPFPENVELSSHSGLALGPHTEPPYYCSIKPFGGHSPTPSTLILTARWNPKHEPTTIIPIKEALDQIGREAVNSLTQKIYNFTRPDSHIAGGDDGRSISILEFNDDGDFAIRYSAYRFTTHKDAPESAKNAINALNAAISSATQIKIELNPTRAILINNTKALHCRDIIEDNRRVLVRLYGYNKFASAIEHSSDPMLVKG